MGFGATPMRRMLALLTIFTVSDPLRGSAQSPDSDSVSPDASLLGSALEPCTQDSDDQTTGWTRTGSCAWDPTDSGYHEVCVTMSEEFLTNSAQKDANDLTSVVQPGGHWCICAWAFAAAVQRDPDTLEGVQLDCARTNGHLREVYESYVAAGADLESPSGAYYEAQAALDKVNELCGAAPVGAEGVMVVDYHRGRLTETHITNETIALVTLAVIAVVAAVVVLLSPGARQEDRREAKPLLR